MRMRDKPTIEVEMSIAAPPARVWELVTDLQLMGHWSPEYQGGEWLDGATGPVVGARFKGRNKRGEREWESVSTVLEAEPGRSFVWAVVNPPNSCRHLALRPHARRQWDAGMPTRPAWPWAVWANGPYYRVT
jgi:uncharacterized protein YndB with AHSA1/START domain